MKLISQSQAGQDLFVAAILDYKRDGRFIDIGCSHPVELSNTYALEKELGWTGILVDSSVDAIRLCREQRTSPSLACDACTCDWGVVFRTHQPTWFVDDQTLMIHYASIDVDEWTHVAAKNLLAFVRPAVVTLEHDFYQRGDRLRGPNRDLMASLGYDLVAADVHSNGCCFESWHCHPKLVDPAKYEPFRSTGLDWADVLKQGGVVV